MVQLETAAFVRAANGEETAAPSEPVTVDHSSEHRLSPSISCHDKAIEPRIELREAI